MIITTAVPRITLPHIYLSPKRIQLKAMGLRRTRTIIAMSQTIIHQKIIPVIIKII